MSSSPRRKTLRQAQTASAEWEDRRTDLELVREAEALELAFDWERATLERCSARVYQLERALLPLDRERLGEIVRRRSLA